MSASDGPSSHQSFRCDICNVSRASVQDFTQHLNSKSHKLQANEINVVGQLRCMICQVPVPAPFHLHENGKKHKQRVKELIEQERRRTPATSVATPASLDAPAAHVYPPGPATLNIPPPRPPPIVPVMVHCNMCDKDLDANGWVDHLEDPKHLRQERLARYSAMIWDSEQDKCGVKVHERILDFGLVDVTSLQNDPQIVGCFHVSLTSECHVELVEAEMSSGSREAEVPKYFTVTSEDVRLDSIIYVINVKFSPEGGHRRYEDRVELVFKDVDLQQHFIITRPVRAIVGVQEDFDLLRPISTHMCDSYTAQEEMTAYASETKVPSHIYDALKDDSLEEQIGLIRKRLLPADFQNETYRYYWKTLLWVEESSLIHDVGRYDVTDKLQEYMLGTNTFFSCSFLDLLGLAERRPSLVMGDSFRAKQHNGPEIWSKGIVHSVSRDQVHLKFRSSTPIFPNTPYDVRFEPNRHSFKRMHTSLENAFYPPRILFPDIDHMGNLQRPTQPEMDDLLLMNHSIRRSPPQLMAVAAIFNLPPGSVPFIISGAPGTGKTITIIEAIRQVLYKDRSIRVLVCAPSNAESDVICELLSPLGPLHLFRLNSPARAVSSVSSNLKQFCREEGGVFAMPHEMQLMKYRVVVSTCIVASTLGQTGITRTHFTHIFVDNAGLPLEPEVLIPMRTIGGLQTNLILSGDPLQLTPEVNSPVVEALGAQISYLDRLMGMPIYDDPLHNGITIVKLSHNFRNHSSILKFSIDAFYAKWQEQSLISVIDSSSALGGGLSQEFPIIFHATKGEDHQPPSGPSYFNPVEASMAKIYVLDSLTSPSFRLTDDDIGIISPYPAQCAVIRSLLEASNPGIKIGTIDEFQGHERRAIIISTVRSNPSLLSHDLIHRLGLLCQPRRLNVAITRARSLLIIIGDPDILGLDPLWRIFLNYIHQQGGWKGGPIPWSPKQEVVIPGSAIKGQNTIYNLFTRSEMGLYMDELEEGSRQVLMRAVTG